MRLNGLVRPTSCCGLKEYHALYMGVPGFETFEPSNLNRSGTAYVATTVSTQKAQAAALKRAGFCEVGRWRNSNTNRLITLWVKNVTPAKKRRTNVGRKSTRVARRTK